MKKLIFLILVFAVVLIIDFRDKFNKDQQNSGLPWYKRRWRMDLGYQVNGTNNTNTKVELLNQLTN